MKNLIIYACKRGGKTMADKLAAEIADAFNEQGGAFKRKEDMHKDGRGQPRVRSLPFLIN